MMSLQTEWKLVAAHVCPCRIEGCDRICREGDICPRCAAEIKAFNDWDAGHAQKPARRIDWSTAVYATAVIGMMAWITFEFRGFIIDTLTLWFGGK